MSYHSWSGGGGPALASSELDCLTALPGSTSFEQSLAPNASVVLFREVVLNVSVPSVAPCPGTRQEGRGASPPVFCSVISISLPLAFRLEAGVRETVGSFNPY